MAPRIPIIAIVGLASAAALFAWAQPATAQQAIEKRFDEVDANRDGKVTPDELPQPALFKRLDLNGDGEITKDEAQQALAAGAAHPAAAPASTDSAPVEAPVRQGPRPLRPGAHGVGQLVPDASFADLESAPHKLSEFSKRRAVVIAMTSTSCPISKKYLPTLVELAKTSGDQVAWVLVNPVATDKTDEMQAAARQFAGTATYVHDAKGLLAQTIGALTTTDVIVIDSARTIVYHGAIDDQYGFGYSIDAPRHRYLAEALTALAAGKSPRVSATEAPGCALDRPTKTRGATEVTYHNRISRLIQQHCLECHRDGGVAPFSLASYDDVVSHAGMIKQVLERGVMPPWFAAASTSKDDAEAAHSPWANDRSLAAAEKQDLLAWIAEGKPAGDQRDAPQPRAFADGWLIGKPDAVYEFSEAVPIKATGTMPYVSIVVDTQLPESQWVQAIEIQPGDRGVVHHVLVLVEGADDNDDGPREDSSVRGGFWGIYVPGNSTLVYPEGFAKRLPKGARLRFQMHYTPNGTATTDRSRIGVIFAKQPPQHEVRVAGIVNTGLSIQPGADNHQEQATLRLPLDVQVLGFLPHMHLRGKACKFEVIKRGDETTTLLDVPRYDFNWQLVYRYFEPLLLHQGDAIRFTGWYDNSSNNPANPDPTKMVRWGEQTYDEMLVGYVEYFVPGATPGESPSIYGRRGAAGEGRRRFDLEAEFKRLDRNSDGKLVADELPEAQREKLMRLDTDKDGAITLEEAKRLLNGG